MLQLRASPAVRSASSHKAFRPKIGGHAKNRGGDSAAVQQPLRLRTQVSENTIQLLRELLTRTHDPSAGRDVRMTSHAPIARSRAVTNWDQVFQATEPGATAESAARQCPQHQRRNAMSLTMVYDRRAERAVNGELPSRAGSEAVQGCDRRPQLHVPRWHAMACPATLPILYASPTL